MAKQKFHKGERVLLPANEKEGWIEEYAIVDGYEGRGMYIITLEKYDHSCDDGLREIYEDNMRKLN